MPTHKHLPKQPPHVCATVRLESGERVDLGHDPRGGVCVHCGRTWKVAA